MDMKALNKANKAIRHAATDIWESAYLCGGYRMKRAAKVAAKRANRRLGKAVIAHELP